MQGVAPNDTRTPSRHGAIIAPLPGATTKKPGASSVAAYTPTGKNATNELARTVPIGPGQ